MSNTEKEMKTLEEFYPFYLSQHRNNLNRLLHAIGTTLGILNCLNAIFTMRIIFILTGLVSAYGCAWVGHFFFEKNKPATFKYPLMSFKSDFIMFKDIITGQIPGKFKKYNIENVRFLPFGFI